MGALDDLLPIRRLLVNDVPQPFARDLNFDGTWLTVSTSDDGVVTVSSDVAVVERTSGSTLALNSANLLLDNESSAPAFVLPAPSTWAGHRTWAKRVGQSADYATITVSGGATIDGAESLKIYGDGFAEFWSDGTNVFVGATTGVVSAGNTPPTLSGAFYAFDPDDVSRLTLVSGAIDSATDALGGAMTISAGASGRRPTRSTAVGDLLNGRAIAKFTRSSSSQLRSTSGAPSGDSPHVVFAVVRINDVSTVTNTYNPIAWVGAGAQSSGLHRYGYAPPTYWSTGNVTHPLSIAWGTPGYDGRAEKLMTAGVWHVMATVYDPATDTKSLYIDGEIFRTATGVAAASLSASFGLGYDDTTTPIDFDCAYAIWGAAVPSHAQIKATMGWLAERFALWRVPQVICLGDSLTYGQRPSPYTSLGGWPALARDNNLVNGGNAEWITDVAVSGWTIENETSAIDIAALYRSNGTRRAGVGLPGDIATLWIGSNDMAGGDNGTTTYTQVQAVLAQLKARGIKTICATVIYRNDNTAGENTQVSAYNAALRAGEGVDYDKLVDLAALTEFQSLTASYTEDTSTPALDGVHLKTGVVGPVGTGTGYGLIAYLMAQAINEVMGV